jgi:tRNA (guanine37-N1)-methyltransferase
MVQSPALFVAPARAQEARRHLKERGIERADLKIHRSSQGVFIPVTSTDGQPPAQGQWTTHDFESNARIRSYKDIVDVPDALRRDLPTSFDIVGDIAIIKIPDLLLDFDAGIGEALLRAHPHLRAIFVDEGVAGQFRVRRLRRIAGTGGSRTRHKEFGLELDVDPALAYFSPRLANEHDRVASLSRGPERVLDATAGVGPYAVALARRNPQAQVVAIDLNPAAVDLLRSNIQKAKVGKHVEALVGDGFALAAHTPGWDRVIVNLPHGEFSDLARLLACMKPGGVLHATRVIETKDANTELEAFAATHGARLAHVGLVHPYSPTSALYAFDLEARITGPSASK